MDDTIFPNEYQISDSILELYKYYMNISSEQKMKRFNRLSRMSTSRSDIDYVPSENSDDSDVEIVEKEEITSEKVKAFIREMCNNVRWDQLSVTYIMTNFSPKELYTSRETIDLYEISSGSLKKWPEPFKKIQRQYIGYIQTSSIELNDYINDCITSNTVNFTVRENIFNIIKSNMKIVIELSEALKDAKGRSLACILTLMLQLSYDGIFNILFR